MDSWNRPIHTTRQRRSSAGGLLLLFCSLTLMSGCQQQPRIRVVVQQTAPLLDIAAREIASRLQEGGYRVQVATGPEASAGLTNAIILNVDAAGSGSKPEGFQIAPIWAGGFLLVRITGSDLRGALWGAQEAADQIVSGGRLEAVRATRENAFLPIRASRLPLPLLSSSVPREARMEVRDRWRQYFDFLARDRFNSVFFQATEPFTRYTHFDGATPDAPSSAPPPADDPSAAIEWLHDIFRMARDRGLDPYLVLAKSALAPVLSRADGSARKTEAPPAPPENSGQDSATSGRSEGVVRQSPINGEGSLPQALPSVLETYPDLAGIALAEDVVAMSGPAERRGAWVAENFLMPLAQKEDRRPVFLGVDGEWWPPKGAFGGVDSVIPVYLWAPFQKLEEAASNSPYPVLWRVDVGPEELRPWQDPNAVREALLRMGAKNSLGFVEDSYWNPPQQAIQEVGSLIPARPPSAEQNWFRAMLWGRMGYSPEVSGGYWEQQFASHFGNRAGPSVYAVAVHSSQVLTLFHSFGGTSGSSSRSTFVPVGGNAPASESSNIEQFLFQPLAGHSYRDFITDALYQRGLLLVQKEDKSGGSPLILAEALERAARQALNAAAIASRYGAWTGANNEEFYQRIQSVATTGLTYADYLRAAHTLARFLVEGGEDSRQQTIQLLQQAQKALTSGEAKFSTARAPTGAAPAPIPAHPSRPAVDQNVLGTPVGALNVGTAEAETDLSSRIERDIEFSRQLQPWRWNKTIWELGTVEKWQPTSSTDVPSPTQWRRAETSSLSEFGLYDRQPWMSSINQQLGTAFLPTNPSSEEPAPSLPKSEGAVGSGSQQSDIARLPTKSEPRPKGSGSAAIPSRDRQGAVASINQGPATATGTEGKPGPGSLLVGKTTIPAKREGRLVLRVVSNELPMVWVNRRRASRLSQQQFPWHAASAPPESLQVQLLSAPVQPGSNEVIVAANANKDNWPLVSLSFLLVPETKDIVSISAREAAGMEGGLVFTPGSEAFPQPHVSLPEEQPGAPSAPSQTGPLQIGPVLNPSRDRKGAVSSSQAAALPLALYRFRIRDPGFYRLRFWYYWRTAESPGVTLALDNSVLKKGLGRGDAIYQMWHWLPLEATVDLGPGEHTLAFSDWKRGAMLGTVEVFPAW